jgi:hypothetical protein
MECEWSNWCTGSPSSLKARQVSLRQKKNALHLAQIQSLETMDNSMMYLSGLVLGSAAFMGMMVNKCKQSKQRKTDTDVYSRLL